MPLTFQEKILRREVEGGVVGRDATRWSGAEWASLARLRGGGLMDVFRSSTAADMVAGSSEACGLIRCLGKDAMSKHWHGQLDVRFHGDRMPQRAVGEY